MVPIALGLGIAVPACSSDHSHPGELGNCIPVADAGCTPPAPGGGVGGGPPDGGQGTDTGASGGCGTTQDLPAQAVASLTQNVDCVPCIEMQEPNGCCASDQACAAIPDCLGLLDCMVPCSTNTTCISACFNMFPTQGATAAYHDFASCVSNTCSPECPILPQ
jgi:hypothetical protein